MYFRKTIEVLIYFAFIAAASLISENFLYTFLFIVIHEIAHGLCAYKLGYKIQMVKLIPIGITANIKEEFIRPADDILISISGPMINFIFFVLLYILKAVCNLKLNNLIEINLFLFLFNILPAEFLDGGRVLRIFIKLYFGFYKAYLISALNGLILGISILFLSIYTKNLLNGIILFVIAVYILFSSYRSKKEIILNVIKDTLFKSKYLKECNKFNIQIKGFNGNVNLLYIIKCFSFKKYYIIYLIQNGSIAYKICESDIIKIYCTHGNIKLEECVKFLNIQEV